MRKLFPLVLSGLMAASFGQLAAAQSVGVQGPAGTSANVDLNKSGSALTRCQNAAAGQPRARARPGPELVRRGQLVAG